MSGLREGVVGGGRWGLGRVGDSGCVCGCIGFRGRWGDGVGGEVANKIRNQVALRAT